MATSGLSRKDLDRKLRDKINASQLITVLGKHATGQCELKNTQIKAAEILLKKVIPDLKSVDHTFDEKGLTVTHITRTIIDPGHSDS